MQKSTLVAAPAVLFTSNVSMARPLEATAAADSAAALAVTVDVCNAVWTGKVARLRIYNDAAGQRVFAYTYPGNNDNYVGYTTDRNMIEALFRNRDDQSGADTLGQYQGLPNPVHRLLIAAPLPSPA